MAFVKAQDFETDVVDNPLEEIEIEFEEPQETVFIEDENGELIEVQMSEDMFAEPKGPEDWNVNLAEFMDEQDLRRLSIDLLEIFEEDKRSRDEWYQTYIDGLDLVGLKIEKRTQPWRDACGVFHPLLAEAIIRYVSEAALELFPPQGPAQIKIVGAETAETRKRAQRVKNELNYQLTKVMKENREELEMTLWRQAMAGSCFRKFYKDPVLKRPKSCIVPADKLVANYSMTDMETGRYTHIMDNTPKNDVMKRMAIGFYRAVNLGEAIVINSATREKEDELQGASPSISLNEDMTLLEMYVDIDLPGFEHTNEDGEETGIKLPYIVTLEEHTGEILSIYRNHDEDEPFKKSRTYFSKYKFLPGFGFYGIGLIHVLGGMTDAATSIMRQLVDAGTISNLPAGFKSRALRIKGDGTPLRPGELRDVDLPPGMVNKSIEWIPSKEPSTVLAGLLTAIVDEGRRLGSITDMKLGDAGANAPVGTTLAIIERNMRVISAVGARNYVSMSEELEMLQRIIAEEMPDKYDYPVDGDFSRAEDFKSVQIIPVADPNGSTMSLRIMRLNAVEQIASRQPHLYDMAYLHRQIVETMDAPNPEKIVPLPDEFMPVDPVTENMNIMMLRPVKAFINQDHEAHIRVHMAAAQDPMMQQIIGQSPNASAIQASMAAHVQEHVAFAYRKRMQEELGMPLPPPGFSLPEEHENALSGLIAEAADRVLGRSKQEAAAQAAQAAAEDPVLQLEQRKVKVAEMEAENKRLATQLKAANDAEKNEILRRKEQLEGMIAIEDMAIRRLGALIDAHKAQADIENKQQDRESKQTIEGIKTAITALEKNEDRNERRETAALNAKAKNSSSKK